MALEQLEDTGIGYSVSDDSGNVRFAIVPVTGIPGDAGLSASELALTDSLPVGSFAIDIANGGSYEKKLAGAGTDKWVKDATIDDVLAAAGSDSWREPARVKDDTVYANLAAAEAAVNGGTIDGVTVVEGDRLLLPFITGSNPNVYIVTGTPGAGATLVEDTNSPTNNDVLVIDEGTDAGKEFHYSSVAVNWIRSNQTTLDELGFIRAFIGKAGAGNIATAFATNNVVTNGQDLESAIGALDGQVGANTGDITILTSALGNLGTEVDAIESSLGGAIGPDGVYIPRILAATNYLESNTSYEDDFTDLDAQIKINEDAIAGLAQGGQASELGVVAQTVIDQVLIDEVAGVTWDVIIRQGNKMRGFFIHSSHDGTTVADATDTDAGSNLSLKQNGNIVGLDVDVIVSGTGATQEMQLVVSATSAVNVYATRTDVNF